MTGLPGWKTERIRGLFLEGGGDEFEVVDDVDVLGALGLALAALEALAGLAVALSDQIVIEFAVAPLLGELLYGVVQAEVLGDSNLLRTTLRSVVTGSARDGDSITDDLGRMVEDGLLLVVEGLEVLHV